jgi:hypothetical protein
MKNLAMRLWRDEAGFVISTEIILVTTILLLGLIVGLATFRDAVLEELADSGEAINNIAQNFSWSSITGHNSSVGGSLVTDVEDFCEDVGNDMQQGTAGNGMCLNLNAGNAVSE